MENTVGVARYRNSFAMMQRTKLFTAKEVSAIYLATSYIKEPRQGEKSQTVFIPKKDLEAFGVSTSSDTHKNWRKEVGSIAKNLTGFSVLRPSQDPDLIEAEAVFYKVSVHRNEGM